jgi:hypothetical protein
MVDRSTLNELKIQVESRHDLEFLRGELLKEVQSPGTKNYIADSREAQRFVDAVFEVVHENVQVDGVDYNSLASESEREFGPFLHDLK